MYFESKNQRFSMQKALRNPGALPGAKIYPNNMVKIMYDIVFQNCENIRKEALDILKI